MSWPEIQQAKESHRYELILSGPAISERIASNGLDVNLFQLSNLNFLRISNTCMEHIPDELGNLIKLTTLDVHGNNLKNIPAAISSLKGLKLLDISGNSLSELPDDVGKLHCLETLNLSDNKLTVLPSLEELGNLARVDVSKNKLVALPEGIYNLEHLSAIHASHNVIKCINEEICKLPRLKILDVSDNKLVSVPLELSQCLKLKDLQLANNPLKDNRLAKMIKQCSTKSILEYIANFYSKETGKKKQAGKKSRGKKGKEEVRSAEVVPSGPVIKILHGDKYRVTVEPSVQEVRPYIVCTIIKSLDLSDLSMFQKFITLQTKLHEKVCDQRTIATIATHDLSSLKFPLIYGTSTMSDTLLTPLGQDKDVTAEQLVTQLKTEALKLKEKSKRNPKTGLYKFLHLVEDATLCAHVRDNYGTILSLPPITNSEKSKIKPGKFHVLVEVTSSVDLGSCKRVMESLIERMLEAGFSSDESSTSLVSDSQESSSADGSESCSRLATEDTDVESDAKGKLILEQVRVVTTDGQLKVIYPSHADLNIKSATLQHI